MHRFSEPVDDFDARKIQPQMPLYGEHRTHGTSNGTGRLLGRTKGQICGPTKFKENFFVDRQASLVRL